MRRFKVRRVLEAPCRSPLVPELDVVDLSTSVAFYVEVLGFRVAYERPAEQFAYLTLDRAELMLQTAAGPGRRFQAAPLERPFGGGVNFQLAVVDVAGTYARVLAAGHPPVVELEDRWYEISPVRKDDSVARARTEIGNRQFVVADPDGYLWRPFQSLGERGRGP